MLPPGLTSSADDGAAQEPASAATVPDADPPDEPVDVPDDAPVLTLQDALETITVEHQEAINAIAEEHLDDVKTALRESR